MENIPGSKSNIGLTYGLTAGLIITIITLLQYLGGLDMFLSPIGYVGYLVVITMAVIASLKARRANEGFLEFREALKITFTVFAVAFLIQTLFSYVLLNFIDVNFKEAYGQVALDKSEEWMRKLGISESRIDEEIEKQRNVNQFSLGRMFISYAMVCIVSFIFCLLISLIVKKNKPAFTNI